MQKILNYKGFIALSVMATLVLGIGAWSFTRAAGSEIMVCVKKSGLVYVIGEGFKKQECKNNDTLLTFNTQGPKGDKGDPGTDGSNGINGENGAPGINGVDGTNGTNGANGADGAPGLNGTDGTNGENGAPGIQGEKGDPGTNGANGTNGTNGSDGTFSTSGFHTHVVCISDKGDMKKIKGAHGGPVSCGASDTEVEMVFKNH